MDLVRGTALAVYSGPLLGGGGLVTNLCRTLVRPVDCNPIGSSVHGVSQARILEWAANFFSRGGSSQSRDQTHVFCIGSHILYC